MTWHLVILLTGLCCAATQDFEPQPIADTNAYDTTDEPDSGYLDPDWLKRLPDSTEIMSMSIPGTHDTMTFPGKGGPAAKCQSWTLTDQLKAGIRYVDIRCRMIDDSFAIHHGVVFQGLMFGNDVLAKCIEYLDEHPTETIFMQVKQEHTTKDCTLSFDQILNNYLRVYPTDRFWLHRRWPKTLGEIRGKIVIVERYSGATVGAPYYQMAIEDHYEVKTLFHIDEKWEYVEKNLNSAVNERNRRQYATYCSGASAGAYPYSVAKRINPRLWEYVKGIKARLGIVLTDFQGAPLVNEMIQSNFR